MKITKYKNVDDVQTQHPIGILSNAIVINFQLRVWRIIEQQQRINKKSKKSLVAHVKVFLHSLRA